MRSRSLPKTRRASPTRKKRRVWPQKPKSRRKVKKKKIKRGGKANSRARVLARQRIPEKLRRMYLHILEGELDRGKSLKIAMRIGAATVNKYRAKLARAKKGPRLVTRGGTRRQWWPGKKLKRETFYCIKHARKFKSKAGLRSHYRGRLHRRSRR